MVLLEGPLEKDAERVRLLQAGVDARKDSLKLGFARCNCREQSLAGTERAASFGRGVGMRERSATGIQLREMMLAASTCRPTRVGRCACECPTTS